MVLPVAPRPLTEMETAVLHRAALGMTLAETAADLLISRESASYARRRAEAALGAKNILNAVLLGLHQNLFPPYPCGTEQAYWWHVRHGKPRDDACRSAHAQERRTQRHRKAGRISSDPVTTR